MIPKRPAPDLIRSGYRFSEKIMLKQEALRNGGRRLAGDCCRVKKRRSVMRLHIAGAIAACVLGACVTAQAQTYPTRELRVVVGLPAGSGGDVVARYYADKLAQLSGKPVIVENKPGMILSIGADAVAKAP